MWWITGALVVLAVAGGAVEIWRAGRRDSHWSRESLLSQGFQFTDWASCIDAAEGLSHTPEDPTVARLAEAHWRKSDGQGAVLVEERPRSGGPKRRVLYLWLPRDPGSGSATYLANMDQLAFDHGDRTTAAAAIVRTVLEHAPGARAAWATEQSVGLALEAAEVTAPAAWAGWLGQVASVAPIGRTPEAPPARWPLDDAD